MNAPLRPVVTPHWMSAPVEGKRRGIPFAGHTGTPATCRVCSGEAPLALPTPATVSPQPAPLEASPAAEPTPPTPGPVGTFRARDVYHRWTTTKTPGVVKCNACGLLKRAAPTKSCYGEVSRDGRAWRRLPHAPPCNAPFIPERRPVSPVVPPLPPNLTRVEKVLVAAASLRSESGWWRHSDLVVRAWEMDPAAFSLNGYPQHPDADLILTKLRGANGCASLGWIRRVAPRSYVVTAKGARRARRLRADGGTLR